MTVKPQTPRRFLRAADKARRIKGKLRHTPLWITEFSWDSRPPDPGGLPMRILSRWTAEAMYRAWSAGVSHFFWLNLTDSPPTPERPFSETIEAGLYFRGATPAENRPKQVFYAFRFPFVAYPHPRGLFVWGRTPTSRPGMVTIQVREGGAWHGVGRVRAGAGGVFSARIRTGYGRGRHGSVRARYRGTDSVPFSMHPVKSFYQRPFG